MLRQEATRALVTQVVPVQVDLPQLGAIDACTGFRALRSCPFVPNDTELSQRIAHREAFDNFSDGLWMIAEDVRVLFQDGWADPGLDKTGAREFVDQCRSVVLGREVASFRMQVSRTTRKVGPGASQRSCASLRFDERNRLGLGHRLAAVLTVRTGQCRGQLEPDNLATNDGRRIHDISVREGSHRHKRAEACIPARLQLIRPDDMTQPRVRLWPREGSRSDTQPPV
jgi:hypothetical protein